MKILTIQHGLFSTEISHADSEPLHADLDDWIKLKSQERELCFHW